MAVEGHCNCGSITVTLPALPGSSILCYCSNCQRSSAGLCSANYVVDASELEIKDANGVLKSYRDSNTNSGNTITRQFCGNCGSPVVSLISPDAAKVFLKAGLFDELTAPSFEAFTENKAPWMGVVKAGRDERTT